MNLKQLFIFVFLVAGKTYSQHAIDQKFEVSAVFDLTREYNFIRAIENVHEFEVEKAKQHGGQYSYQVKGQSQLCHFNSPYLSQKEFDQLFVQSPLNSKKANLKSGVVLDVTDADSFARHFGAECLSGQYVEDVHSDVPGDRQFVCNKLSEPTSTIVYLTVKFKVHPKITSVLSQGFLNCYKQVPFGQSVDFSIFELEADLPKMGLKLLN